MIRKTTASMVSPIMAITGFRFSRAYRHEATRFHSIVYRFVDTVAANYTADDIETESKVILTATTFALIGFGFGAMTMFHILS